ncbi:aminoglycoside phosphotransferase family protein [Thiofilum flexile]|uniref:aminoglycoside phosphotransferase family protein n=1 Tax=Thiofilum flexile TaxID=125627 RepID=UPI00037DF4F5|nr:phosphotransferase [Thiofilum flexile]
MTQDARFIQLTAWIHSLPQWETALISPASADASFRRYFRATTAQQTAIIMDAPPDKISLTPFLDVTTRLHQAEVRVPHIYAQNNLEGFLLLEDFGNTVCLEQLSPANADQLYTTAMESILRLQQADHNQLAEYTPEFLMMELNLMPEWFLKRHLGLADHETPHALLQSTFDALVESAREQPFCFIHRDYHSRNLMLLPNDEIGIIDYQDAFFGPITYDLVSLLRDCYISWPEHRIQRWALTFHKQAIAAGNMPPVDEITFMRWFDLMGLQRHIKVLGIFCRLYYRDGKSQYLADLARVLLYVMEVGERHSETRALVAWLEKMDIPERIGMIELAA